MFSDQELQIVDSLKNLRELKTIADCLRQILLSLQDIKNNIGKIVVEEETDENNSEIYYKEI